MVGWITASRRIKWSVLVEVILGLPERAQLFLEPVDCVLFNAAETVDWAIPSRLAISRWGMFSFAKIAICARC